MRLWSRAGRGYLCGFCGALIAPGEPMLFLMMGEIVKVRCRACAAVPVPADLPDTVVTTAARPPIRALKPIAQVAGDWKRRAAGREPGEEG